MPHKTTIIGIIAALTASAPLATDAQCPVDPATGYPVFVIGADSNRPGVEYLDSFASAFAYRWRVPSRQRNAYRGWDRITKRAVTPEPLWARDWSPEARHTSHIEVVVRANGHYDFQIVRSSGDGRFDGTIQTVFDNPMPGAPDWPPFPDTGVSYDSLIVHIMLGGEPPDGSHGLIRFAAAQTPVELVDGTLRVNPPPGLRRPSATVKYDVLGNGVVAPGSIEILQTSDPALGQAIELALQRARFLAPTANCRPIRQTVVQTFGN